MWTMDSAGNIEIPISDTLDLLLTDILINGVVANWANFSEVEFIVKVAASKDATILFSAKRTTGEIDCTVNGQLLIKKHLPSVSALIENTIYNYDLRFTSTSGVVTTWLNNKKFKVIS